MGNKASASQSPQSTKDQQYDCHAGTGSLSSAAMTKIRVMGKFSYGHRMRVEERAELYRAIAELKEDRRRLSFDLEQEKLAREAASQRNTGKGAPWETDKPAWTAYENDHSCALCGKEAKRTQEFPCRVCFRVFHKLCLAKCGECRDADLKAADNALSNDGWSCYICGNLSLLLTEDEINQLINEFDIYDTDNDEHVSWEEFNARNKRDSKGRNSEPDLELSRRLDFKLADLDNDDNLDWWEFLNYNAKLLIARRSKDELLALLTEKEVIKCRSLFRSMDTDNDGVLTILEARQAVRNWCQRFAYGASVEGLPDVTSRLDLHSDVRAKMFVDGDNKKRESVTWPEFLADQAAFIICARPNVNAHDLESACKS